MKPRLAMLLALSTLAAACDGASPSGADASGPDARSADVTDATARDVTATDATSDTSATDTANDAVKDSTAADVTAADVADVTAADVADVATTDVVTDAAPFDVSAPDADLADAPASDAAVVAPDAAGLCAMLPANTAPVIMDTFTLTPMPSLATLAGGVVQPGTYHETQHIYHGVATGTVHTWQATTRFYPGANVAAVNINRDGAVFQQLAERIDYAGSGMLVTIACPSALAGMMVPFGYSYAGGELRVYSYFDNTETVFTRQ